MNGSLAALLFFGCSVVALTGCDRQSADAGPPAIALGNSVCAECNMIISDERFATASMIDGPRGAEPRLFDDFNCQINFENEHTDQIVLTRWSHEYDQPAWFKTQGAYFLLSPKLQTPMASSAAAFASQEAAENARQRLGGEVLRFDAAWKRINSPEIQR